MQGRDEDGARELAGRVALLHGEGAALRASADRLRDAGAYVETVMAADDEAAWDAAFRGVLDRHGRLDILLVAADDVSPTPMSALPLASFRAHHRRSLHPAFLGLRGAAAAMRRRGAGGAVILVTGLSGRRPDAGMSAAASVDGALLLLAKAAALELGPDRIRVNVVQAAQGMPGDVAEVVLFLASDRSAFMTGADIVIDGGALAGMVAEARVAPV